MRRVYIVLAVVVALYLDSIFFARINISGIRPDAMLALVAGASVLLGSKKGALLGLVCGLIADVLYSRMIGLSSIGYMVCGAAGGFFYQKYYADNLVIPSAVAAAGAFFKEHIMALVLKLTGGEFSYLIVLSTYIVPCVLMTTALSIPIHLFMKRILSGQVRAEHRMMRDTPGSGGVK